MKTKICTKCKTEKELSEFHKCKNMNDGHKHICKVCRKTPSKEYQINNKEKIKEYRHAYYLKNKKIINKKTIKYRKDNKTKVNKQQREHYRNNKQKISENSMQYFQKNKKKIIEKQLQKRKKFPRVKIRHNLQSRIRMAIKRHNKALSTMLLVGCDIDYLMYHLQEQFAKDMSWDNYGDWHIDHIKPCARFDLSSPSQQIKCFHYTNLQPLWAEDNWSKGAK